MQWGQRASEIAACCYRAVEAVYCPLKQVCWCPGSVTITDGTCLPLATFAFSACTGGLPVFVSCCALPLFFYAALVAFMMLYGLSHEDIAYLRSKDKTGLYKSAKDMPEDLNSYIEANNPKDMELWNLANARLNDTIQQLQPECFQQQLQTFTAIQAAVKRECADYRQWYADHGFSNTTHSYVSDNGWGFR